MKYASLRDGLQLAICPSINGGGGIVPDLSGRSNHGTLVNMDGGGYASGRGGLAFRFDGVNDFVSVFDSTFANFGTGPFCLSLWLQAAPFAADRALLSKDDWDLGTTGLLIYSSIGTPNHIFYYSSGTTGNSFGAIADNTWHHIGISRQSTATNQTNLFLDGRLFATITDSLNYSNSRRFRIGNDDDGNRCFPGMIDDVRVYSRALVAPEHAMLAVEPGIGLRPERTSVFFGAALFNAAWARNSNVILSPVGAA